MIDFKSKVKAESVAFIKSLEVTEEDKFFFLEENEYYLFQMTTHRKDYGGENYFLFDYSTETSPKQVAIYWSLMEEIFPHYDFKMTIPEDHNCSWFRVDYKIKENVLKLPVDDKSDDFPKIASAGKKHFTPFNPFHGCLGAEDYALKRAWQLGFNGYKAINVIRNFSEHFALLFGQRVREDLSYQRKLLKKVQRSARSSKGRYTFGKTKSEEAYLDSILDLKIKEG